MSKHPIERGVFARAAIAAASVAITATMLPQQAAGQPMSYPEGTRSGTAFPSEPSWGGIYALGQDLRRSNDLLPRWIYTTPYIDGIVIKAQWSQIEPSPGIYDWSLVDQEVNAAVASGKKITVGVKAGVATPAWLYGAPYNVPYARFEAGPHGGTRNRGCARVKLPVPWNSNFERAFAAMIEALSEHLQKIPGAFGLVTRVKLSGINTTDDEFYLAHECGGRDADTVTWQGLGYTPDLIFAAGQTLDSAVATAFPNQLLDLDLIVGPGDGMPPINDAGQIVSKKDPTYVNVEWKLINWALSSDSGFYARFGVQWDAFGTDAARSPRMVVRAGTLGAATGWQLNDWGGRDKGSECGDTEQVAVICDDHRYGKILNGAIRKDGEFLEVWSANVPNYPAAFLHAQALLQGAQTTGIGKSLTARSAPPGNSSTSFP